MPLIAIATVIGSLVLARAIHFHEIPFRDRKAVLEDVVSEIRLMNLTPGEVNQFRMDDLSNAKSLRPVKLNSLFYGSNGSEQAGNVYAIVSPAGSLKVEIVTYDWHHFGRSGFAFSDDRLKPEDDGEGYLMLDVPGELDCPDPSTEIDAHWWKVHSTID